MASITSTWSLPSPVAVRPRRGVLTTTSGWGVVARRGSAAGGAPAGRSCFGAVRQLFLLPHHTHIHHISSACGRCFTHIDRAEAVRVLTDRAAEQVGPDCGHLPPSASQLTPNCLNGLYAWTCVASHRGPSRETRNRDSGSHRTHCHWRSPKLMLRARQMNTLPLPQRATRGAQPSPPSICV
jgi:hypothetical protein